MSRKISPERKGAVLAALCALTAAASDWIKSGAPAVDAVNRNLGAGNETNRAEILAVAPNLTEETFEEWKAATEAAAQKVALAAGGDSHSDSETESAAAATPAKTSAKKAKGGDKAQHPHEKFECGCGESKTRQATNGDCISCGKPASEAKWKALGLVFALVVALFSVVEPVAAAGLIASENGIAIGLLGLGGMRVMAPAGDNPGGGGGPDDALDLSDAETPITGLGDNIKKVGDLKALIAPPENYSPEKIAAAMGQQASEFGASTDWQTLAAQAKAAGMTQKHLDEFGVGFLQNINKAGEAEAAALLESHKTAGITDYTALTNSINAAVPGGGKLTEEDAKSMPVDLLQTMKALATQKNLPTPGAPNNPAPGFDKENSVEWGGKTYGLDPKDKASISAFAETLVEQTRPDGKTEKVPLIKVSQAAQTLLRKVRLGV